MFYFDPCCNVCTHSIHAKVDLNVLAHLPMVSVMVWSDGDWSWDAEISSEVGFHSRLLVNPGGVTVPGLDGYSHSLTGDCGESDFV